MPDEHGEDEEKATDACAVNSWDGQLDRATEAKATEKAAEKAHSLTRSRRRHASKHGRNVQCSPEEVGKGLVNETLTVENESATYGLNIAQAPVD